MQNGLRQNHSEAELNQMNAVQSRGPQPGVSVELTVKGFLCCHFNWECRSDVVSPIFLMTVHFVDWQMKRFTHLPVCTMAERLDVVNVVLLAVLADLENALELVAEAVVTRVGRRMHRIFYC